MTRTTVNIDLDHLRAAREALGTEGTSDTVNAALAEVARRRRLAGFRLDDLQLEGTPEAFLEDRRRVREPAPG